MRKTMILPMVFILLAAFAGVLWWRGSDKTNVVQNSADAILIARTALTEKFGNAQEDEKLVAEYDGANGVWHVHGILPESTVNRIQLGGTSHVIISAQDGCIIDSWHEK